MEFIEITSDNAEDFSAYIDEDMADDLDRVFFRGIGALEGGSPVGAIVYELKDSENEDDTKSRIHVLGGESDEIKGRLIEEYKKGLAEDEVLESFYETGDEILAGILEKNGFSSSQVEGPEIEVTIEDIKKLISVLKITRFPEHIQSISGLSLLQYRTFIKNCLFKGRHGICEDLSYLSKNWFEPDVSSCAVIDEKVEGMLLLKKTPSGKLIPQLYVDLGPDSKKDLLFLLAHTCVKTVEMYPADTKVIIRRHNDSVRNLTNKLIAGRKGDMVFFGTRNEG
ncbi:MAG: hypothetical protein IKI75_00115 [Lachnospiraceae bacterium]|nr:hypothetical protein [Lachnospiraceae bacterium]